MHHGIGHMVERVSLGKVKRSTPSASDTWWSSLETCSNLFICGPSPPSSDLWWWPLKLKHARFQAVGTLPTGMLSFTICMQYI